MTPAQPTDPERGIDAGRRSIPEPRPAEVPGPPSGAGATPPDGAANEAAARPKRRRLRTVIFAVLGATAFLCLGGLGTAYVAYDKATEPNRTSPAAVVDNYLQATFNARSDAQARLYTCKDPKALTDSQAQVADVQDLERRHGARIAVSWDGPIARTSGSVSSVEVTLRLNVVVGGKPQEELQRWQFSLINQGGWRVCDAHHVVG
jgi:hypothetical protein